ERCGILATGEHQTLIGGRLVTRLTPEHLIERWDRPGRLCRRRCAVPPSRHELTNRTRAGGGGPESFRTTATFGYPDMRI
ncbi:hypothetical protein AB0N05_35540, partial [Nocardia sp. NPDC051030]|uniref:hypothetical protein n=1 Tax=Nocardia sp. NPDC051030 TaxID=3155162 RepID=UPI00341D25C7